MKHDATNIDNTAKGNVTPGVLQFFVSAGLSRPLAKKTPHVTSTSTKTRKKRSVEERISSSLSCASFTPFTLPIASHHIQQQRTNTTPLPAIEYE
jgi:hypothetical protein